MLEEFIDKQVVLTMISKDGSESEVHGHKVTEVQGNLLKLDNSTIINTNSLHFVKSYIAMNYSELNEYYV